MPFQVTERQPALRPKDRSQQALDPRQQRIEDERQG